MPLVDISIVDKMIKAAQEDESSLEKREREAFLRAPAWVRLCVRLAGVFPSHGDQLQALAHDYEGDGSSGPRWVARSK
jgi:hypothetical protein